MCFVHRLSELHVNVAALTSAGWSTARNAVWKMTLRACKRAFKERETSDSEYRDACKAIKCVASKEKAEENGKAALATYRYFSEGRLRATMSVHFEGKLPFEWHLNSSGFAIQEIALNLDVLLTPMNRSRSRIMRHLPVSVIANVMDVIANSGGEDSSWWQQADNVHKIKRRAIRMAQSQPENIISEEEKSNIIVGTELFVNSINLLAMFLEDRDLFSFVTFTPIFEKKLCERSQRAVDQNSQGSGLGFMTCKDASRILACVYHLCPTMSAEYYLFIATQRDLMQTGNIPTHRNICYIGKNGHGKDECMYCNDPVLLDVLYMLSDVLKCISTFRNQCSEEIVGHIMPVLVEPWEQRKSVHFRKMFMLAVALTDGLDEKEVDISSLVEGIMEKMEDDGSFIKGRKKRAKTSKRETKRSVGLQPRVIYVSRGDSDSDERTQKKRGKAPISADNTSDGESNDGSHKSADESSNESSERATADASQQAGDERIVDAVDVEAVEVDADVASPTERTRTTKNRSRDTTKQRSSMRDPISSVNKNTTSEDHSTASTDDSDGEKQEALSASVHQDALKSGSSTRTMGTARLAVARLSPALEVRFPVKTRSRASKLANSPSIRAPLALQPSTTPVSASKPSLPIQPSSPGRAQPPQPRRMLLALTQVLLGRSLELNAVVGGQLIPLISLHYGMQKVMALIRRPNNKKKIKSAPFNLLPHQLRLK